MPNRNAIILTLTAARHMVNEARKLFEDGSGNSVYSDENYVGDIPGIIDNLPVASTEHRWGQAVLFFLKYIHGTIEFLVQHMNDDETGFPPNPQEVFPDEFEQMIDRL